ncbi:metallophosphoesterase family protein [Clostridium uliginosum]|uniref:DNA repair exonuclease SbcCD nuclease subunit n=1 Tax=Clostridium uliginosum TaxID=119641 RepID=A0A1I1I6B8_9CLOT|nr:DNA repair exonuclease [Clostridium uliginosum]SFC31857.1 DNA repair exonuclease SbcCD nuclease subunit [Clostridium uliginosum]
MNKIRILHTADLHFDTPFSGMPHNQALRSKEELKEVFNTIIDITLEEKVDILLIAGDIFDNLSVNKSTLYFIKNCFERINKVKVFISPGNHDPFNERSFYNIVDWPENVHVFKGDMKKVVIEDLNTVVWGAGFNSTYIEESLLKNVKRIEGYNNIMLLHGEITYLGQNNSYNPITEIEIGESNMDYIALGHRHKYSDIKKIKNTYYSYSGCPQGRGFDELGDKGVVLIDVLDKYCEFKFIKTSLRNYYEKEINIDNCFTYNEIKERILNSIEEKDIRNNCYKIILIGEISEEFNLKEELIEQALKNDFYFIKIIDKTEVKLDMDELLKGYSIKSIFAKKMYEELEKAETEEDKEIIKLALKKGLQSLSGEEVRDYNY